MWTRSGIAMFPDLWQVTHWARSRYHVLTHSMTSHCCRLSEVYFIPVTTRKKVWELFEGPSYFLMDWFVPWLYSPLRTFVSFMTDALVSYYVPFCVSLFLTALVNYSLPLPVISGCAMSLFFHVLNFCNHSCLINSNHMPQPLWQFCSNIYKIRGFI